MDFIWGIDKEADIYCTSVKVSMKNQGEQLDIVINQTAEQMRIDNWEGADREKVIKTIVSFVEENVKSEGWSLIDEDGVSWFLGIYCKAFVNQRAGL